MQRVTQMDVVKVSPQFGFRSLDTGLCVSFDDATKLIIEQLQQNVEGVPQELSWENQWTEYLNEVYPKVQDVELADDILMRAFFAALDAGNSAAAADILRLGFVNRAIGELFSVYVLPSQN